MSGNGSAGRGTADGVGAATGTVRRSTADQEPGLAWEQRLAAAWSRLDALPAPQFRALIDALAAELPPDSAVAAFERAGAFDSTGRPDRAVPLYRLALERGVEGVRRRRAKIQLASSLRNLGRPEEGVALLSRNWTPSRTSWTTRCGRSSGCVSPTRAGSARRWRWRSARSPRICRAISGRCGTTRAG